eukprot:1205905-Ditylum_brightwellii.AAC.1
MPKLSRKRKAMRFMPLQRKTRITTSRQTNTIINVCITDIDAKSYISKLLQSLLAAQEKGKR